MSAVVEAVSNVVESVVDTVGSAVEAVGDAVTTVADKVGDTVQAVIDNPLPVLVAVAGQMVGIPAPLTMGALTAAQGGSLEDIALSAGTAYFAPSGGNALSSSLSESFLDIGFNETISQVASTSISKGLVNGTIAEIKGGSFEDGFAGGFTGGMVAGGVGEVGSYVKDDVIQLAQDSGLNLKDATSLYNAGTKAFSAGVTSEVTGRGDFATSFANSAVGSSIDYGSRSLNNTIDEQFKTASTDWNEKNNKETPIDLAVTGAGIPDDIITAVKVSDIGVDTKPVDVPKEDYAENKIIDDAITATTTPEVTLAQAPKAETAEQITKAETPPAPAEAVAQTEPVGGLSALAEPQKPVDLSSITSPITTATPETPVISEAPIATNLLTTPTDQPVPAGGLSAVKTADDKMAEAQGFKATDVTKPLVATAGNLLKSALTQKKSAPRPPAGALQMASAKPRMTPTMPPAKMDVSQLIPIQRAGAMPPRTLPSTARLSPVTNIAGLSSLLKKTG
jgi:hypothetical protein